MFLAKRVSLGSPKKGSNSEGKILAYKKKQEKQVDLISSMVVLIACFFPFSPFFVAVGG